MLRYKVHNVQLPLYGLQLGDSTLTEILPSWHESSSCFLQPAFFRYRVCICCYPKICGL